MHLYKELSCFVFLIVLVSLLFKCRFFLYSLYFNDIKWVPISGCFDAVCPYGYHGPDCKQKCKCDDDACACHHITGLCTFDSNDIAYAGRMKAGQCLANRALNSKNLSPERTFFQEPYAIGCVVATVIAVVSLMCNIALLCYRCTRRVTSHPYLVCPKPRRARKYHIIRQRDLEFDDTEETESSLWFQ